MNAPFYALDLTRRECLFFLTCPYLPYSRAEKMPLKNKLFCSYIYLFALLLPYITCDIDSLCLSFSLYSGRAEKGQNDDLTSSLLVKWQGRKEGREGQVRQITNSLLLKTRAKKP